MKSIFLRIASIAGWVLLAALSAVAPAQAQITSTMVRLHTTQGPIDMKLLDTEAPLTVANFLAYVRGSDYTNNLVHRSAWSPGPVPFVVQAGGYRWNEGVNCCTAVASRGTVLNEFSATRSNVRGTVAMAKVGDNPNSATSQWFFNMSNNAANLDNQNGGFTVFARLTVPGLAIADQIAALRRATHLNSPFSELPVTADWLTGTTPTRSQVVIINRVTEFPAIQSNNDRILNYIEAAYPTYLNTAPDAAGEVQGYTYRYYAPYGVYMTIKDGRVAYYVPWQDPNTLHDIGTTDFWLGIAAGDGY